MESPFATEAQEPSHAGPTPSERIEALQSLESHPAWKNEVLPAIHTMLEDHIEAAVNPKHTPDQRMEHIQAIPTLRKLITLPADRINAIAAARKLRQSNSTTAP